MLKVKGNTFKIRGDECQVVSELVVLMGGLRRRMMEQSELSPEQADKVLRRAAEIAITEDRDNGDN